MEKDAFAEEMNEINGVTWWSKAGKGPRGAKQNSICRGRGKKRSWGFSRTAMCNGSSLDWGKDEDGLTWVYKGAGN